MRLTARASLLIVILLAGMLVLPRSISGVGTGVAVAQFPTPIVSDIIGKPTPSPDDDDDDGGGEDGGGSEDPGDGGGSGPGGGGGPGDLPGQGDKDKDKGGKNDKDKDDSKKDKDKRKDKNGPKDGLGGKNKKKKNKKDKSSIFPGVPSIPGSFNTDKLLAVAAHLRSLGHSQSEVSKGLPAVHHRGGLNLDRHLGRAALRARTDRENARGPGRFLQLRGSDPRPGSRNRQLLRRWSRRHHRACRTSPTAPTGT